MPDRIISRVPKYRHYKPKDLAVVRINGRDHYLGRFGSVESQEAYRRLLAEWLSRGNGHPTQANREDVSERITVNELILSYVKFADS
jgi:hypothetical protein